MDKKRWSIIVVILFLAQSTLTSPIFSFENSSLNPPTLDPNCPEGRIKQLLASAIYLGVALYKLEALEGLTKEEIATRDPSLFLNTRVHFDINKIYTLMHEGALIRYYPFSMEGKNFIMRIFLPYDGVRPPDATVLYEIRLQHPEVVFQILPSLNEILPPCRPRRTYSTRQVDSSS